MQHSEWISTLFAFISFFSGRAVQFALSVFHWPRVEPGPSAWSPNHWTTREFPRSLCLRFFSLQVITEYWLQFPLFISRSLLVSCSGLCASLMVAEMVKNLPTVQETWVQSLVWEDPLEKGMATPNRRFVLFDPLHLISPCTPCLWQPSICLLYPCLLLIFSRYHM